MNDETRKDDPMEENTDENWEPNILKADAAVDMVAELQGEVDDLRFTLNEAAARIVELEAPAAPAGDAELRALAVTVRTAQRNGHPDAVKHMDALLRALGA